MKKFRGKENKDPEMNSPEPIVDSTEMFQVRNLTEMTFPLQIFDDSGQITNLSIRIQGRMGQKPPVIRKTQITDQARELEKKRIIKLVKVN